MTWYIVVPCCGPLLRFSPLAFSGINQHIHTLHAQTHRNWMLSGNREALKLLKGGVVIKRLTLSLTHSQPSTVKPWKGWTTFLHEVDVLAMLTQKDTLPELCRKPSQDLQAQDENLQSIKRKPVCFFFKSNRFDSKNWAFINLILPSQKCYKKKKKKQNIFRAVQLSLLLVFVSGIYTVVIVVR